MFFNRNRLDARGRARSLCLRSRQLSRRRLSLEILEDRVVPASAVTLGPLQFFGDFNTGPEYSANGVIQLGLAPTQGEDFRPLVQINGSVAFSSGGSSFTVDGSIISIIQPTPSEIALWQGNDSFDVAALVGSGATLSGSLVVSFNENQGANFTAGFISDTLILANPDGGSTSDSQVHLQGRLSFPQLAGLVAPVSDGFYVTLDHTGISLPGTYTANVSATGPNNRFTLFGLAIDPSPGMAIAFDANQGAFVGYGPVGVYSSDGGIAATGHSLGTRPQPGLVLQGGAVTSSAISIDEKLELFTLPFELDHPTMHLNLTQQRWEIWGDASFDITGAYMQGSLGDQTDPGIVLSATTGTLESVRLVIDRNFTLGPLVFEPHNFTLTYQSNGVYTIAGSMSIPILFNASATVGAAGHPGIVIDNGTLQIHNFKIQFDDLYLGTFVIDDLFVSFSNDGGPVEVDFGGSLWLPLMDRGLTMEIDFNEEGLNGIKIGEHGVQIPVGDTGVFITAIDAELKGLTTSAKTFLVAGSLTLTWGPKIHLLDKLDVALFKASGEFLVDQDHLELKGSFIIGAWTDPVDGSTQALLAKGTCWVDLNWSENDYRTGLEVDWLDGTFSVRAEMDVRVGKHDEIMFRGEADVNVPDFVPFIGGDEIGGVDFAFLYRFDAPPSHSYVAVWTEVDLLVDTETIGFKVDFTGDFSVIGSDDVDSIKDETEQKAPTQFEYSSNFPVPAGVTKLVMGVKWPTAGGQQTLAVTLPNGTTITQDKFSSANGISLITNQSTPTARYVQIVGPDPETPIPAGVYKLTLVSSGVNKYSTPPKFSSQVFYFKPVATLPAALPLYAAGSVPVEIRAKADVALVPLTTVSLYLDFDDQGYDGIPIVGAQNLPLANAQYDPQTKEYVIPTTWDLTGLLPLPHYVYAVIHDTVNPPITSAYSGPVTPQPPLSGFVTDVAPGPGHNNQAIPGITVFLDSNGNQLYDPGVDPSTITGPSGYYSFYNLQSGQDYWVGVVIPHGYILAPIQGNTNPVNFTYTGDPSNINFGLYKLASISGVVFADMNMDGQKQDDEPGLTGWTVTLSSNGTDIATAYTGTDGGYAFPALSPGTYTVTLMPQVNYFQTGPTPIPPGTYTVTINPTNDDPYPQVLHQHFGVMQYSTLTGKVTGHQLINGRLDHNTVPLEGWTIELLQNGQVIRTTTSAADGSYTFQGLVPGDYTVRQSVPANWRQLSPFQSQLQFADPVFIPNQAPNSQAGMASAIVVADFDKDGYLDFATPWRIDFDRGVNIFFGRGDGTFPDVISYDVPLTVNPLPLNYQLLAADMAGSGRPDLLLVDANGTIYRLVNNGNRNFTVQSSTLHLSQGANLLPDDARRGHFVVADFDNDGREDIAASYFSHPSGQYGYYHLYIIFGGNKAPLDIPYIAVTPLSAGGGLAAGDLNNDGWVDLVFAGGGTVRNNVTSFPTTSFALNLGHGSFRAPFNAIGNSTSYDLGIGGGAAVADIDGDGRLDAVTGNSGVVGISETLGLATVKINGRTNTGQTAFILTTQYQDPGTANYKVFLEDLDGDLRPDLILYPASPDKPWSVRVNQGNYKFSSSPHLFSLTQGRHANLAFGDLNGDGLLDMLVDDWVLFGTHIFLNTSVINDAINVNLAPFQDALVNFVNGQLGLINGRVFADTNRDGKEVRGEPGLAGVTVYLDLDGNGRLDPDEPSVVTGPDGGYAFSDLPDGTYQVRVDAGPYRRLTTHTDGFHQAVISAGAGPQGLVNFGLTNHIHWTLTMPSGGGDWTLVRKGEWLEIRQRNGSLVERHRIADVQSITIHGSDKSDRLTVDLAHGGYFTLPGSITFHGGSGTNDVLRYILGSSDDVIALNGTTATIERGPNGAWSGIETLVVHAGNGNDLIQVLGQFEAELRLLGGHGHDTYRLATVHSNLRLIDVGGKDKLDFAQATHGVHVSLGLRRGESQNIGGGNTLRLEGKWEILVGSAFKDTLTAGNFPAVLLGMGGDDVLRAGTGRSVLIGGPGRDTLIGSRNRSWGGSILLGEGTHYDGDDQALLAVLAEWTSERSWSQRVANLSGVGTGPRLNGDVFLNDAGVIHDGQADLLRGGGTDWLLGFVEDVVRRTWK